MKNAVFVVDKNGNKHSKSEAEKSGKPIDAAHYYNKYGADIIRLWVSSVDWESSVPFSEEIFKQVAEPYRRLRNTLRILLGNLDGFQPQSAPAEPAYTLLDRWILERLNAVTTECLKAYETYEFRKVFNALNQFCTTDLSAVYIDALKDRMYCDAADSPRRIASQAAMYQVFVSLAKLLAPILAYTADEAWEHAGFCDKSIHERDFPQADAAFAPGDATEKANRLFAIKSVIQTAIEARIQAKEFTRNNEAAVTLTLPVSPVGAPRRPGSEMPARRSTRAPSSAPAGRQWPLSGSQGRPPYSRPTHRRPASAHRPRGALLVHGVRRADGETR